ncbi:MAG TPA: hypothetical protein VGE74_13080 [Gemmata sp.]
MSTDPKPKWYAPYIPWLIRLVIAVVSAFGTYLAIPPAVIEVIKEVPVPVAQADPVPAPAPDDARFATGWVDDPGAVAAVAATLPHPVFARTPAGAADTVPDRAYLWDAAKAALGRHVPARDQGGVGSCVSFGAACAVEYSECVAVVAARAAGHQVPAFQDIAQEVIYGGSRVQIGGGRIRGDGSVGAWAAQWCQRYGSVPRGRYDGYDLTRYSESTCRSFGNGGCPAALVPVAKRAPTQSISQVKTADEARKALAAGYPVTVASDVGFGTRGPYVRNAKGQLRASGSWAHQMCLIGFDKASGFYCMNSWGPAWVSGPTGPGDPPPGGFWIDEPTVARMLGQGDSWAFGDQVGFPGRALDWFVNRTPPRRTREPLERFALAP